MSNESNEIVNNLKRVDAWLRLLLMVVYAALLYVVAAPVVAVLIVAQALFALIAGGPNDNLRRFGAMLGEYIHQVVRFLTYNTDERPFPFSPFPEGGDAGAPEAPAEARDAPASPREDGDVPYGRTPEGGGPEGRTPGGGAADNGRPFQGG